ncbi:MAG: PIN domain-containing protein [Thermomicrobiales bacterium]
MIVAADASVLVAELTRARGFELILDPRLHVVVAEEQWNESQHEITRRLTLRAARGHLTVEQELRIQHSIQTMLDRGAIEIVLPHTYLHLEAVARRRIPRDPNDWPTVALAIALDAGILTNDHDFLGCGCPTWTVETLRGELAEQ